MKPLPLSGDLPVHHLAACFNTRIRRLAEPAFNDRENPPLYRFLEGGATIELQGDWHAARDLRAVRDLWRLVLLKHPQLTCIYSGEVLSPVDYGVDHFVPWSFVTHDQLWTSRRSRRRHAA